MALLPATSFAPAMPAVPWGPELEAFAVCGCSPPGAAHGGHTQPHGSHRLSVLCWGAASPQPQPRPWCHPCGQARGWAQLCVLARVARSSLLAIQGSDRPQGHVGTLPPLSPPARGPGCPLGGTRPCRWPPSRAMLVAVGSPPPRAGSRGSTSVLGAGQGGSGNAAHRHFVWLGWAEVRALDLNAKVCCSGAHKGPIVCK